MKKKIHYLFFALFYIFYFFIYHNIVLANNITSEEIKNTYGENVDNNKQTVEIINNNLVQMQEQNLTEITAVETNIFKPTDDGYYKDFDTFTTTKNNLNVLRKALLRYAKSNSAISNKRNKSDDKDIENSEDTQEEDMYNKDIGNVYLKTVLYLSKNNWSIWINDKKITNIDNGNEDNEFYITKVNENQVDFVWRIFRSKFKIVNSNNKITSDMYEENEETNRIEIKLSLHPNQTFVASENKVIDGKYSEDKFILDKEFKQQQKQIQEIIEEDINFDELMKNL